MDFNTNIENIFEINRKAHAVIMSCQTVQHIQGAKQYVLNVENMYSFIKCTDNIQSSYLVKSLNNIKTVLKIQIKKLNAV